MFFMVLFDAKRRKSESLAAVGRRGKIQISFWAEVGLVGNRGSGVLRSCAEGLLNVGVEESHVGLVTGGQGRACNGQLSMQGVVFQTWCGENSTHPLSCIVASTRRGTTTDCDFSACGKRPSYRCRDQGGHPRRHHVATAGHVWTGQGRKGRAKQALNMAGRQAEATSRLHDPG